MYKFELYEKIQQKTSEILEEAKKAADEIGIPKGERGKFGLGGGSGTPPTLSADVLKVMHETSRKVIPLKNLVDQIREVVKDVYGDEFDAVPVATAEAALWVTFDVLLTPPQQGRGDNYMSSYIAPYERHLHHQGGYGRPFPPKYKDLLSDRGVTAGEFGINGKRLNNLSTIIVPLVGARYEVHGIKYYVTPLLTNVNAQASIRRIKTVAERHLSTLAGFTSLGYDTIGYGYGEKDEDGTPKLQKYLGELAMEYDVPYVCDNARGLPFVGIDPRRNKADVMIYSMDKAAGAPTSGLIIGRDDVMVPIRKALGMHSERRGTVSAYGKAAYVIADPGKEALAGLITSLNKLKDEPLKLTKATEDMYGIVTEELKAIHPDLAEGIKISRSINGNFIEANYSDTWKDDKVGIPIFSIEDMYAGTNLIQTGLNYMGVRPALAYDGNIVINTRQGTTDEEGSLIESRARYAVKALVNVLEIICKCADII